jgi:hypothetical protein
MPSKSRASSSQRWRATKSLALFVKVEVVARIALVAFSSALTPYSSRTIPAPEGSGERRNCQGLFYGCPAQFGAGLKQSQMVGILGLQRTHQEFKLGKAA